MRYQKLIDEMTLDEKCALLSGGDPFGTRPLRRLGIPRMQFSDGPHGLRVQDTSANHLGMGGSKPATCFPTAATVANSWDPKLGYELGQALGEEALAQGVQAILGPGMNIKRSPLCGRNFEYFSEDPLLTGVMASSYVEGIQSTGVSACPKHFAANSQETRRMASDSVIDERTLHEIYLAGFAFVVKHSHPRCLMTSYNLINGTYVNEDRHLVTDILRDSWGFTGAVVTDWIASHDHPRAVAAGSTFEMPAPGIGSVRELVKAVESGRIREKDVDVRVDEALTLIFSTVETGEAKAHAKALADRKTPAGVRSSQPSAASFDAEGHHRLAQKIASESAVLMKNEDILPLASHTRVALIGDFAAHPRYQGAGSSLVNSTKIETLVNAIGDYDLAFVGYEPGFERDGSENEVAASAAIDLAKAADVVVLSLGLNESRETEGMERSDMKLSANQTALLARIAKANPKIVVLLSAGSSVETEWATDAKAILNLYLGGQAGARAALDVLTGAVNPSGKLNETWPCSLSDTPMSGTYPSTAPQSFYKEGLYVGYRYYQKAGVPVAYPFGFGLSYTTFTYTDMQVTGSFEEGFSVSANISNAGSCRGKEVVQLYVAKCGGVVFAPEQELRAFCKVDLAAGEAGMVRFVLDKKAFPYYNVKTQGWEVEAGDYEIRIGASCEDIRLSERIHLAGTYAPDPYEGKELKAYRTGTVSGVSLDGFSELFGEKLKVKRVKIGPDMCFRDLNHGRSPLFWIIWAILRHMARPPKNGVPDLNVHFIYNMPLHALTKSSNGFISAEMVDALVLELKGFWIIGLLLFVIRLLENVVADRSYAKRLSDDF